MTFKSFRDFCQLILLEEINQCRLLFFPQEGVLRQRVGFLAIAPQWVLDLWPLTLQRNFLRCHLHIHSLGLLYESLKRRLSALSLKGS